MKLAACREEGETLSWSKYPSRHHFDLAAVPEVDSFRRPQGQHVPLEILPSISLRRLERASNSLDQHLGHLGLSCGWWCRQSGRVCWSWMVGKKPVSSSWFWSCYVSSGCFFASSQRHYVHVAVMEDSFQRRPDWDWAERQLPLLSWIWPWQYERIVGETTRFMSCMGYGVVVRCNNTMPIYTIGNSSFPTLIN